MCQGAVTPSHQPRDSQIWAPSGPCPDHAIWHSHPWAAPGRVGQGKPVVLPSSQSEDRGAPCHAHQPSPIQEASSAKSSLTRLPVSPHQSPFTVTMENRASRMNKSLTLAKTTPKAKFTPKPSLLWGQPSHICQSLLIFHQRLLQRCGRFSHPTTAK